ncbi:MAG: transcriptional regulator, SARP family protein, partial [Saccharothrix sp.]|nr:transcriptional regulator, SARP family protein [Saccharothrix sp.]
MAQLHGAGATVEFRLLGAVTVLVDGAVVDSGPARQRCVLAALAVDAGEVVSVDRLIHRVWGEHSPLRARQTLVSYVSRLRQLLAGDTGDTAAVVRRSGGYSLVVRPSTIDLYRFLDLRSRAVAQDAKRAAALLEEALGLWRGEALAGLSGDWVAAERDRLHRERLAAESDLTDARLALGEGAGLVVELAARAVEHPLDERTAGQYLLALHRAGRTADALTHYHRVREHLVEELGIDPGVALRELYRLILAGDPTLLGEPERAGEREDTTPDDERASGDTHAPATTSAVTPRQLPVTPAQFVGRHEELDLLDAALLDQAWTTTVVISAIAGAGGIGKTWLALHWAHRHAERFPDGQLFVDLRGFSPDGAPMEPAVAARGFLDALGVEPHRLPVDPHAQTALFRSLVEGRRMLVVLDNAATSDQVVPLLPGGTACTVVVTSRHRLPGLVARHGARPLSLDVLTDAEAHTVLVSALGAARVAEQRPAVAELVGMCGGFPLALGVIAARARAEPRLPLDRIVAELRESGLGALADEDPSANLPAVLSWSLRHLTGDQREVFAQLGVAPGPDISLAAAAGLTDRPQAEARQVLRVLQDASLVDRDVRGRYAMHDLVRAFATATAQDLAEPVRRAALHRVVDFYLHTAHAAAHVLDPHRTPVPVDRPAPGARPSPPADEVAAMAW